MYITWYGQSCFKLQNNERTVLINPSDPRKVGLKGPNFKANIFVLTDMGDSIDKKVLEKDNGFLINGPGEYEVNKIFVYGVPIKKDGQIKSVVYQVTMNDIRYGVLGQLEFLPSGEELDRLDGVDVLFIPIGGEDTLSAEKAVELVNSIEPQIVIPCCYDIHGINTKLDSLEKFLKEMGGKVNETLPKLSIKKKDLLGQVETRIVILENN